MAERVKIPRKRAGAHNPGGAKAPLGLDLSELTALQQAEYDLNLKWRTERANSKKLTVTATPSQYSDLLKLAEAQHREVKSMAQECFNYGVAFYLNPGVPYGGGRPMAMLDGVRGPVMPEEPETQSFGSHPRNVMRREEQDPPDTGWLPNAGIASATTHGFHPKVAVAAIDESEPEYEEAPMEEPGQEEIEVEV